MMRTRIVILAALVAGSPPTVRAQAQRPIKVVTTLPTYAAIARAVLGDRGTVTAIAQGAEEPHFVQPRPSFVPLIAGADVFVTTGLDLELWVPALLDKANNPRVSEGGRGYVAAYAGIPLLEVPSTLSRSEGDIHIYGNPHIHTDPINAILVARNVAAGLIRVAPRDSAYFAQHADAFAQHILEALYGPEVVRIVTPQVLLDLALKRGEWAFLQRTTYQGTPLADRLGGWIKQAEPLRGREMVCYHREWVYFSARFGIPCADYLEPKPGIPPSPRHVQEVIEMMRARHIPVVFSPNYFDRRQTQEIASRTGGRAVIVAAQTEGAPGVTTYDDLITLWVQELVAAVGAVPRPS
jgi:ABC-type Zn uptake system ZnuABC Zn-binding protein ZnuA